MAIFLAVMGAVGLGVERSVAYDVGSISSNPPARTVTYGNWVATSFDLTAPVTAAASKPVAWGVTGLPQNTTALFSAEAVKEGVASATLIVTQAAGTSGPVVGSYTITVTAELNSRGKKW